VKFIYKDYQTDLPDEAANKLGAQR